MSVELTSFSDLLESTDDHGSNRAGALCWDRRQEQRVSYRTRCATCVPPFVGASTRVIRCHGVVAMLRVRACEHGHAWLRILIAPPDLGMALDDHPSAGLRRISTF